MNNTQTTSNLSLKLLNIKALQVDFILPCNPYILLTKMTANICTTMLEHLG